MAQRLIAATLIAISASCVTYRPPSTTAAPRQGVQVQASFNATWEAAIDAFAETNVPIATMDRGSGFIASEQIDAGSRGSRFADCGEFVGEVVDPSLATYNVIVRGDSSSSTVRVTAAFARPDIGGRCVSRGTFETIMENRILARAEGHEQLPGSTSAALNVPPGEAVVIVPLAVVREAPDADAAVVAELRRGTRGHVRGLVNQVWVMLEWDGGTGYVHSEDLVQG